MTDRNKELATQFLATRHSLLAFIYGLARNPEVAEDILQEVWIRLAEAVERREDIQNLNGWCRGVARNLILHYWRDKQTQPVITDSEIMELAAEALSENENLLSVVKPSAYQEFLNKCMSALPHRSRELLALKYEQGLTAVEIAKRIPQSAAAIVMALSRIRKSLAECVENRARMPGALQ